MLDITIHDKINQTYRTFKCPSFEVVYEEKDRICIPVHVLAPFIKKSTYLDYIEIFVKGNKYANGKLFFFRNNLVPNRFNNTINFFFIE